MNQEIKQKWVNALRSGEYIQTITALKRVISENEKPRYCCLGVLCDLYVKEKNLEWEKSNSVDSEKQMLLNSFSYLPHDVREWAELEELNPIIRDSDNLEIESLAQLNDTKNLKFDVIADLIEKYF